MTERTYGNGGKTLDELEGHLNLPMSVISPASAKALIAHIRSLQAEVARLAEERDEFIKLKDDAVEFATKVAAEAAADIARLAEGEKRMRDPDDATLVRLAEAAVEEWAAMSEGLGLYHWPHGNPVDHRFISPGNFRILRAILKALPLSVDGEKR